MNIVKQVFLGLAIMLVLLLVIGFFLPSEMKIVAEVDIKAEPQQVFFIVDDFEEINKLNYCYQMDSTMQTETTGNQGEPGYQMVWSSNNTDLGSGTITRIETNQYAYIINKNYFQQFDDSSDERWDFTPVENGTSVRWTISDSLGNNLVMRYMCLMMNGVMKDQMQSSLERLKAKCEAPIVIMSSNLMEEDGVDSLRTGE